MKPIVLMIIDGFGYKEEVHGNAVKAANMKWFPKLWEEYPHSLLEASGTSVGLPSGQMGNSEVGHLNIGSGRVIYQPLELINKSIKDKTFFQNESFIKVMNHVKENHSKLHLFGLLSDGGIHSHINHFYALLEMAKVEGVKDVYIHAFLDGRDTLPEVAEAFLDALSAKIKELGLGVIADISGRYYSMDRERMWNVTKQYYDLLTEGNAPFIKDYHTYLKESYQEGISDEFIVPALLDPNGKLEEKDGLIFVNFRPDRATQLFTAITNPEFKEFPRKEFEHISLVTMMPVEKTIIGEHAFQELDIKQPLGVYLSERGYRVLRLAEASKYPHVTYFFDGGLELELPLTTKIIVPRKDVATYDLYPAMSSYEVADRLIEHIEEYDVVVMNFANCDMVGHTGKWTETIEAIQAVDENLGRIYQTIQEIGGTLIVTADHGNAEVMLDENHQIITSHTTSKVPFILCDHNYQVQDGKLSDIAPTILHLLGEKVPSLMTGEVICQKSSTTL